MCIYYIHASWKAVLPLSWALEVIATERLHVCMGSPVYDEEAEVNHWCLITSNVMCLATTAKCETIDISYILLYPVVYNIYGRILLCEDRR